MDCCLDYSLQACSSPYKLLFKGISSVPLSHYFLALFILSVIILYNFLDFHFFQDLRSGCQGSLVSLSYNSSSEIYDGVVSKCHLLNERYLATPWLSSPHFQTAFLNFFGRPPTVNYRRQLFHASDGGTIALDWLLSCDVLGSDVHKDKSISKDDTTPIVVVIPGLTSDSDSAYIKHLAFNVAKMNWNVVVSNHRGLGGISITSDCFYNAGWTEDARGVIRYLHHEFPAAPLFAVGTSIGANILVKYLGEDGENLPVAGAVAISCPWDLLIGDRFIKRKIVQKLYDKALASGLQGYAQLHQHRYSRLANWDGIKKSRSIRDFDISATCLVGKFETVDTYYRRCSSANFVCNVSVPLLCLSALDDPLCSKETIPWDECRANKNVVLATTEHGGHLAFFEGIKASSLWWVRAVTEFLSVLSNSPYMHIQKQNPFRCGALESSIDRGPYVNITADGMVGAIGNAERKSEKDNKVSDDEVLYQKQFVIPEASVSPMESSDPRMESSDPPMESSEPWTESFDARIISTDPRIESSDHHTKYLNSGTESFNHRMKTSVTPMGSSDSRVQASNPEIEASDSKIKNFEILRRCQTLISRRKKWSAWLVCIAVMASYPLLGSVLGSIFKRRKHKKTL